MRNLIKCFLTILLSACAVHAADLSAGFDSPPDNARPLTWWHWINGHVTKEGIREDLVAMKEAGIAGVQLFDVSIYMPMGPVRYGSDNWHEHVQYAISTASELGMELSLMNTPGWSASGGPWVTPEKSMKKLVWTETEVTSDGAAVGTALPVPFTKEGFYKDIAVLAVPADPEGNLLASPLLESAVSSTETKLDALFDNNRGTIVEFPARTQNMVFSFSEDVTAGQLSFVLTGVAGDFSCRGAIEYSSDGKEFTRIGTFGLGMHEGVPAQIVIPFAPTKARYFRLNFSAGADSRTIGYSLAELTLSNPPRLPNWWLKLKESSGSITRLPVDAGASRAIPRGKIIDVSAGMAADGSCRVTLPPGRWTLLRFGYTSTGKKNHPAAPEGHGLEVDKFDAEAVAFQFEKSLGRIIREAGPLAGKTLKGILFDSFEGGYQTWTDSFPGQFREQHGYDLLPLLPALTGRIIESTAFTESLLHDFRAVINSSYAKNYFGVMQGMAHQHGIIVYAEAQGNALNPAIISPYTDVVMCEFWHHSRFPARLKLLASIANILDRRILAAEALSARPEEDGWGAPLASLKRPGDHAFASGVNRFVLHTYAHQPFSNAAPGFTLGRYGTRFGRLNTWWSAMPAWTAYIARSQFVLQQGWKHADMLLLQNEDLGYAFPRGEITRLPDGLDFDVGYPKDIAAMTMRDGMLTLPHGPAYRLLVTPAMGWAADVETLRRLHEYVKEGLAIYGNPPVAPEGMRDLKAREQYDSLVKTLWGGLDARKFSEKKIGRGRVMRGGVMSEAVEAIGLARDLDWSSRDVKGGMDEGINFIHRRTKDADIYFVFNNTENPVDGVFDFRVSGRQPELWDAVAGARTNLLVFSSEKERTRIPLQFAPYGSTFIVFQKPLARNTTTTVSVGIGKAATSQAAPSLGQGIELRSGVLYASTDKPVELRNASGSTKTLPALPRSALPTMLEGSWQLEFLDGRGAPKSVVFDKLSSWSEHSDDAIRHYSGSAVYRKSFKLPPGFSARDGLVAFLDLGKVADVASVRVNGRECAILWIAPFRADITSFLKPGENLLEIKVTNTWVNRLIGDERIPVEYGYQPKGTSKFTDGRLLDTPSWMYSPEEGNKNPRHSFSAWRHYDAESPLLPAGLLGPVRIEWLRSITAD